MRRLMMTVAVSSLLTLAGCGGQVVGTPGPASTSAGAPAADVGSCFDGDCELSVSGKVTIPLEDRFQIESLTAEVINTDQVKLSYRGFGGSGNVTLRRTGTVNVGGITVRTVSLDDGTAVLRITNRR